MPASTPSIHSSSCKTVLACLVAAAGLLALVDLTVLHGLGLASAKASLAATCELGHLPPSLKFLSIASIQGAAASLAGKVLDATLVPHALAKTLLGLNGVLLLLTLAQALWARHQQRRTERKTSGPVSPIKSLAPEPLAAKPSFQAVFQYIAPVPDQRGQQPAAADSLSAAAGPKERRGV